MSGSGTDVATTGRPAKRTAYWGALDGMRAFGVVVVMLYHLGKDTGGFLAVDMFFVISGFLITSLLLGEREKTGRVSMRDFYMRRALRLLPALVVALVGAVALTVAVAAQHAARRGTVHGLPFVFFYVGNWKLAYQGQDALGVLTHTWSLAVEEQFYILWPAVFLLLLRTVKSSRRIAAILLPASFAIAFYRWEVFHWGIARVYYATDTHCDGLLLGCALAFVMAARRPGFATPAPGPGRRPAEWALSALAVLAAAFMGFEWFHADIVSRWSLGVTMPVFNVATCVVIVDQVTSRTPLLTQLLNWAPARWLGRRSYAIYLWHPLTNKFVEATPLDRHGQWLFIGTCMVLAVVVGGLSWRLVESPFLRLKTRFERSEATPRGLMAPVPQGT